MITGRGPGAPGVTPGMAFTRRVAAQGEPGDQTTDLSAIRRSDAIIDLLARRRLARPRSLHDPALAALSALAEDVDAPAAVKGACSCPACRREDGAGGAAPAASWPRAAIAATAVVGALAAGIAGTTGIVAAGMLARLARLPAKPRELADWAGTASTAGPPPWWGAAPWQGRPRRRPR